MKINFSIMVLIFAGILYADWNLTSGSLNTGTKTIASFVVQNDTILVALNNGNLIRQIKGGAWETLSSGLPASVSSSGVYRMSSGTIYAGMSTGAIYYTKNNGDTWVKAYESSTLTSGTETIIECGKTVIGGTKQNGILVNNGESDAFELRNSGLEYILHLSNNSTKNLTMHNGAIFVGCTTDDSLFRSIDTGKSWQGVAGTGIPENLSLIGLVSFKGALLFNGGDNKFYRSTDNGATFTAVDFAVAGFCVYNDSLLFGYEKQSTGKLNVSTDGVTFTTIDSKGLPAYIGPWIHTPQKIMVNGGYVYTVASDNKIYKRPLSEMLSSVTVASAKKISSRVYPVTIKKLNNYLVEIVNKNTSAVTVKVFSLNGEFLKKVSIAGNALTITSIRHVTNGILFFKFYNDTGIENGKTIPLFN
jgi:hypothetical protein